MNRTNDTGRLAQRRRYRQWMGYAVGTGIIGGAAFLLAGTFLERNVLVVLGVGVYWLGVFTHPLIERLAPVAVRDERERQISREAAELTLDGVGYLLIVAAPAVTALAVTGVYDAPEVVWGAIAGIALVGVVLCGANWHVERRRT